MLVLLAVFENILKAFVKDTKKVGNTMEYTQLLSTFKTLNEVCF